MIDFTETYNLLEWGTDYYKLFWDRANKGVLDQVSFHWAFDKQLINLGIDLQELFSDQNSSSLLKHKGVYGIIKQAEIDTKSHYAVKALKKFWVLQFVDRAQLQTDIDKKAREEQVAKQAELERQRKEEEDKLTVKNKEIADRLTTVLPDVEKIAKDTYGKLVDDHAVEIKSLETRIHKLYNECTTLLKTTDYLPIFDVKDFDLDNSKLKVKATVSQSISWSRISIEEPSISVELSKPGWSTYISGIKENDLDNLSEVITTKLTAKITDEMNKRVKYLKNEIVKHEDLLNDTRIKRSEGKEAHEDVNQGRSVDEFVNKINDLISKANKKASSDRSFWYGPHDDGDSGLAYSMSISNSISNIYPYLIDCNVIYLDYKYKADNSSIDQLRDLLEAAICHSGSITIVSDTEIDNEESGEVDSSDELLDSTFR